MVVMTISGKAQHGKDSTANILKEKLEKLEKKVIILHYADYLKYMCQQYFGWNGIKDDNGRTILQHIGTDIIRQRNPDFWVEVVAKFIEVFQSDYDYFLIPDARFPNEIEYFRERGIPTIAIWVRRVNFESNLTEEQKNHYSENALNSFNFHVEIVSESGLHKLAKAIEPLIPLLPFLERQVLLENQI